MRRGAARPRTCSPRARSPLATAWPGRGPPSPHTHPPPSGGGSGGRSLAPPQLPAASGGCWLPPGRGGRGRTTGPHGERGRRPGLGGGRRRAGPRPGAAGAEERALGAARPHSPKPGWTLVISAMAQLRPGQPGCGARCGGAAVCRTPRGGCSQLGMQELPTGPDAAQAPPGGPVRPSRASRRPAPPRGRPAVTRQVSALRPRLQGEEPGGSGACAWAGRASDAAPAVRGRARGRWAQPWSAGSSTEQALLPSLPQGKTLRWWRRRGGGGCEAGAAGVKQRARRPAASPNKDGGGRAGRARRPASSRRG